MEDQNQTSPEPPQTNSLNVAASASNTQPQATNTSQAPLQPTPLTLAPSVASQTTRQKLRFFDRSRLQADNILDLLFRLGFATIFLTNAVAAIVQPASFLKLIEQNFVAEMVGHYTFQLRIIAVNDAILGVLILIGFKKKYVYGWAGLWLLIVTFFKITSLV